MGKNSQKSVVRKQNVGRALFKSRFSNNDDSGSTADRWLHTCELEDTSDWSKTKNAKSVTEQNSLDDFLATAEMAGTEFESEKLNLHFVAPKPNVGILNKEQQKLIKDVQEKHKHCLRIPRRPVWKNEDYDAKTLQLKERESFLEWRRGLAELQENDHLSMTPFEKNLEFWRQLWRVIERSDVIVQIVDARNPLLFYCNDLETYVKEIDSNKVNVLLVNKSDFLSDKQRLEWHRYFKSKNIYAIFWSAALATEIVELEDDKSTSERNRTNSHRSDLTEEDDEEHNNKDANELSDLDEEEEEEEEDRNVNKFKVLSDEKSNDEEEKSESGSEQHEEDEDEESSEEEEDEEVEEEEEPIKKEIPNTKTETQEKVPDATEDLNEKMSELNMTDEEREGSRILNREELIHLFKTVHKSVDKAKAGLNTIGLVGYPNVGKSSTINAILMDKKTAVSDTPGKTKHYQTLFVDDELLLCDCPGLVFPSFVSTRGELILNGILPIDQMRDYVEPINLASNHIPKTTLEMYYGMQIQKPKEGQDQNRLPNAEEICSAYAVYRGYMNHKGTPDVQRSARYILKDYVNGKLLYCYPPPGIEPESFQDYKYEMSKEAKYLLKINKIQQRMKQSKPKLSNFDQDFFVASEPRALTKGGIVSYFRQNQVVPRGTDVNDLMHLPGDKPWKKHNNKNKREKLRRKTSHFDQAVY